MSYNPQPRSFSSTRVILSCLAALAIGACAQPTPVEGDTGTGGTSQTGGATGTGGHETGGTTGTGGTATGGTTGTGGAGTGGVIGTGGAKGGSTGTGGSGTGGTGTGGTGTGGGKGGSTGTGGMGTGGLTGTGGMIGTGGAKGGTTGTGGTGTGGAKGGASGTGGTSATGGTAGGTDPCSVKTSPTGGTQHTSSNASGTAAGLNWTIWSNGSAGSITTYSTPAFSAAWNNSGDFLARIGLQWNDTKTYDQLGTINAEYNETRSGSGGGYSYIGIYGWSVSPCVEWYIVDDSYNTMPVNPGNGTNKGTATIDGGTYNLLLRNTSGTGGSKCSGVSSWSQFYSIRTKARTCGQISISEHFKAWAAAGMTLGKMDQAQILVEVGGGSGSVTFPVANVTAQ
jgi:endo-1,4-beta-xylanase